MSPPITFANLALSALAALAGDSDDPDLSPLAAHRGPFAADRLAVAVSAALLRQGTEDRRCLQLADAMHLDGVDLLVLALTTSVELDVWVGRAVARLQAPLGGSRPTLALLAAALAPLGPRATTGALASSAAIQSGLVELLVPEAPLAERPVRLPAAVAMALRGRRALPPGVTEVVSAVPLAASVSALAQEHAAALGRPGRALVVRSSADEEASAAAIAVAGALGRSAVRVEGDAPGLTAWLHLADCAVVRRVEATPGERVRVSAPTGWQGPLLVLTGPDGLVQVEGRTAWTWDLPDPDPDERRLLWTRALGAEKPWIDALARDHLHGAARIATLGSLARHHADARGAPSPTRQDVDAAVLGAEGTGLEALAQRVFDRVPDDALVVSDAVRSDLLHLLARCRRRDTLETGLGPAMTARRRPGVRALLSGPPGTGKTLAASWLATRLGLPMFRVDLAGVVSKYIGETEKNLAALLARAEAAEVVLLFDEADALFARRTDVKTSNDRFANTQTNYLLQRLETWKGIAVLTTNSRGRLDEGFARRLDVVIELTAPGPAERRQLWEAHLGAHHTVSRAELNRLATAAEISGGHVRNVVLAAAALAREEGREIAWVDLVRGLELEFRKIGTRLPDVLRG